MSRSQPARSESDLEFERLLALGDSVSIEKELARIESRAPALARELRLRVELQRRISELCAGPDARLGAALAGWFQGASSDELRAELLAEVEGDCEGLVPRLVELEPLARGGMSEILRVWDPALKRELALKRLAPDGDPSRAPTATQVRRFIDEARITGSLEHPSVVPLHHFGLDREGRLYFTMQRVPGPTLGEVIERVHAGDAVWSLPRAVRALLTVCEAAAFAHEQGVIHRDIKPSNVKVGRFGEVYLLDWGVARRIDQSEDGEEQADEAAAADPLRTVAGVVVGTPAYMAPECARGDGDFGPRSDVYSLGAVLYHLLAGQPPFGRPATRERSSQVATLERVVSGPPAPLAEVAPGADPELVSICERAMRRDADQRYPDARAMSDDLNAWLDGRVVRAHARGALAELRKWTLRNRLTAALLGAVFLGALSFSAWTVRSNRLLELARNEAVRGRDAARAGNELARLVEAASAADAGELRLAQLALEVVSDRAADWEWQHLSFRVDSSEGVLSDLGSPIRSAALSLDRRRVLAACDDGFVRWIDAASGLETGRVHVESGAPLKLALAPDGSCVAVGCSDGAVEVWDIQGRKLARGRVDYLPVDALACSDGGAYVVVGYGDAGWFQRGLARESASLVPLWTRKGRAYAARFLPDSRVVVASCDDRWSGRQALTRIDAASGQFLGLLALARERILDLEFDPSGSQLALAGWDRSLALHGSDPRRPSWSVEHRARDRTRALPATTLAFDPSGERLVSAGWDRSLHVWRRADGLHLERRSGHVDRVTQVAFLADGRVISSSLDGTLRTWDLGSPLGLRRLEHPHWVFGVDYAPDGQRLATACRDGKVRIFDRRSGQLLGCEIGLGMHAVSVSWSADGRWLAALDSYYPGNSAWWTGYSLIDARSGELAFRSLGMVGGAQELAFLGDSRRLALARENGTVAIVEARTGEVQRELDSGTGARITSVDPAPDGRRLVAGGFDGMVRVWDLESGTCERVFNEHGFPVRAARWSPDGTRIASCAAEYDHTIRTNILIWEAATGRVTHALVGGELGVLDVAWSPDGRRLASADENGRARIWDTGSGECVLWMRDNDAWLGSLAWSPDGRELAAGGADGVLRIWASRPPATPR